MIRSQKRMRICLILLALNILFIWCNSLLTREISSAFSKLVGRFFGLFVSGPLTPAEGEGHGILRKIAHFTEFTTLGVLMGWHVRMLDLRKWSYVALPILSGLVIAFVDETIQYFIPGRGPGLLDVGIDLSGVVIGTVLISLIALISQKKKLCNAVPKV